jgi:hypothetical protein
MRMRSGAWLALGLLGIVLLAPGPADAQKKTLTIGLNQDPDILDPTLARTYVGRIVFASMCEKLYEIDENLNIEPQLAAEMPRFTDGGKTVTIKLLSGVKFNDGTPMDAAAVKFSLDRHRDMKGSTRKSELALVTEVEAPDPLTVRIRLSKPFSPIVAVLADRAGMPVSPTQARKLDDKFGTAPVCVGPWASRSASPRPIVSTGPRTTDPARPSSTAVFRSPRPGDIDIDRASPRLTPRPSARKGSSRCPAGRASATTASRSTSTTRPGSTRPGATSARPWPTTPGCGRPSSFRSTALP